MSVVNQDKCWHKLGWQRCKHLVHCCHWDRPCSPRVCTHCMF